MLEAKKEAKLEFPGEGGGKQEPGECGHFLELQIILLQVAGINCLMYQCLPLIL